METKIDILEKVLDAADLVTINCANLSIQKSNNFSLFFNPTLNCYKFDILDERKWRSIYIEEEELLEGSFEGDKFTIPKKDGSYIYLNFFSVVPMDVTEISENTP